ncbi:MAG: SH3 domain-containing protein [Clostridium sp.]|nr:SH3 domain-containing protein [Clostridium sp.]
MQKVKIKKIIALSGVIGGMLALNSVQAHAVDFTDSTSNDNHEQNINGRLSNKGQVVNVDSTYLRIRAEASISSEVLGTMIEGTKFDIISKSEQWYQIQYNNITGYVFEDYVDEISEGSSSTTYDVMYTGTVYDAAPNLRVRSGASLNSAVIGYVLDNSQVSIVAIEDGWYKIQYNGGYGYVSADYISIGNTGNVGNNSGNYSIIAVGYAYGLENTSLRIRQEASISSAIIGSVYEGDSVNIIGEDGNWYKILYNNSTAYVSKDYVTLNYTSEEIDTDNNSTVRSGYVINVEGSNLRVRKSASLSGMVLGYLVNNESVEIIGQEGNWYKINYRNSTGYVDSDYIQVGTGGTSNDNSSSGSFSNSDAYSIILNSMKAQVGAPYVWGGSGEYLTTNSLNELKIRFPEDTSYGEYIHAEGYVNQGHRAFDCSGLVQWAFAQAGINVGRTTYSQINAGIEVNLSSVQLGDLLFSADLGHVGMYIGDNQWIEASYTGNYVRINDVPWGHVSRARRVLN